MTHRPGLLLRIACVPPSTQRSPRHLNALQLRSSSSSNQITKEQLHQIAQLSRLRLASKTQDSNSQENNLQENEMLRDLNTLISFFQKIKEVNTENVPPLITLMETQGMPLREENSEKGPSNPEYEAVVKTEELLRNSKNKNGNYFVVPKVIE